MKQINKREPTEFIEWKANYYGPDSDMTPGWGEFDASPMKQTVKAALIKEQGGLCCYCEKEFNRNLGHIAHFRAKSLPENAHLTLAYDNLFYSCPENQKGKPQTCGHAQGVETPPISPLDVDCEYRFIFSADGGILPRNRNDDDAIRTIEILNLNDQQAVFYGKRAEVYQVVMEKRSELPSDVFNHWITNMLERQSDGSFQEFWTTRKYAAGLYT